MPKNVQYRILEHRENERWVRFGVAYQRGDHLGLFATPWRAHKPLEAASLEALTAEHCPSGEFRWQDDVKTCPVEVTHPMQLLEWEAAVQMVPDMPEHLEGQAMSPELASRLQSILLLTPVQLAQVLEQALEVDLNKQRKRSIVSQKFGGSKSEPQTRVEVDTGQGIVRVWSRRAKLPSPPPLVLLMPQTRGGKAYAALPSRTGPALAAAVDVVHFDDVPDGRYLVVVVPVREAEHEAR